MPEPQKPSPPAPVKPSPRARTKMYPRFTSTVAFSTHLEWERYLGCEVKNYDSAASKPFTDGVECWCGKPSACSDGQCSEHGAPWNTK